MARALVEIRVSEQGPSILVESTASEGSPAFVDAAAASDVVLSATDIRALDAITVDGERTFDSGFVSRSTPPRAHV